MQTADTMTASRSAIAQKHSTLRTIRRVRSGKRRRSPEAYSIGWVDMSERETDFESINHPSVGTSDLLPHLVKRGEVERSDDVLVTVVPVVIASLDQITNLYPVAIPIVQRGAVERAVVHEVHFGIERRFPIPECTRIDLGDDVR